MYHIVIDPEFQSLIPALGRQEHEALTQSLLRDGCREPLSVMEDVDDCGDICYVLLDGHNRHEICEVHGLPYEIRAIKGLMSREEVRQWIIGNQLCRRNLTEEQVAYYRGEHYRHERFEVPNPTGRNQHAEVGDQSDHQPPEKTAEKLARQHGVSPGTIRRDAQYAEAVDRLVSFLGPDFRRRLLAHKTGLTKKDVLALAAFDGRRLQHIADKKMDLKKCAKTKRRYLRENAPIQMEFAFIDTWRTRVAEARDALHNGDQDAVDTILAELLDELEKVKKQHAAR
ncbi:MAG TPA: hypothetical protein PKI11_17460 [Candidatus Hydrogenedentes bacterium]|nr:hypothetical protein [Candidatus Hydrogenedentota bacterium]